MEYVLNLWYGMSLGEKTPGSFVRIQSKEMRVMALFNGQQAIVERHHPGEVRVIYGGFAFADGYGHGYVRATINLYGIAHIVYWRTSLVERTRGVAEVPVNGHFYEIPLTWYLTE